MKLLVIDDDVRDMSHVCDYFRITGNDVLHCSKWSEVESAVTTFKPNGIILDLMMSTMGLPIQECDGGYTTGIYIYKHIIHKNAPNTPFIIFSASDRNSDFVRNAIEVLESDYPSFSGYFSKGCDEEAIINALSA